MRTINITFEDAEFESLKRSKDASCMDWRLFVLDMLRAWRDEKWCVDDNK